MKLKDILNEIKKPTIVVYNGKRLAVDPEDIERLKSGKDIVGKSTKYAGEEEWILAKGKWKVESVNEVRISRGTSIEVFGKNIMVNGAKLTKVTLAYVEGTDRLYRGYLFTENGQINLSGGDSGLKEFSDAINYNYQRLGISLNEFLKGYGVEVSSSDFDVS